MIDRETAAQLILQKVVLDELRGVDRELRDHVAGDMRPGDAASAEVGDVPLGRVSMSKPRESVRVDESALLAWALEHRPDEVETITRVRPSFVAAITAAKGHIKERVDQFTGEVIPECDVPGVTIANADRGVLTVAPTIDARILARVWVQQIPSQLTPEPQPEIER